MSRPTPPPSQVFRLFGYGNSRSDFVVITPEPMALETVAAAWAYAVRYTAKGLDLPDHKAAIQMFSERHPSWTILEYVITDIPVNLAYAEQDVPENQ